MSRIVRIDTLHSGDRHSCAANGDGIRVVVWWLGCSHMCPGCHNQEYLNFDNDKFPEFSEEHINQVIEETHKYEKIYSGLSILGGEPFEPANQEAVLHLLKKVRKEFPSKTIWCYTGNILETDIIDPYGRAYTEFSDELLKYIDVLVDGPFISELKNISLRFRGSENQRLINLPETLKQNKVILWNDGLGRKEIKED